jgi:hypothetical protein
LVEVIVTRIKPILADLLIIDAIKKPESFGTTLRSLEVRFENGMKGCPAALRYVQKNEPL